MMQLHVDAISQQVGADRHVVLVLDNAGWHTTGHLDVPDNITLLPLPACTPELNVVERLWHWIKDHDFSNRIYPDYDVLVEEVSRMWQQVSTERIRSVCRCSWLHEN
jgi:transposase